MSISENMIPLIGGLYVVMMFLEAGEYAVEHVFFFKSLTQQCSIYARSYLIAYSVVKCFFYLFRLLGIYITTKVPKFYGALSLTINLILWLLGIYAYYIAEAAEFFKKENDCREKASDLYYGMLYVFIEGCATTLVIVGYAIGAIVVGCYIMFKGY